MGHVIISPLKVIEFSALHPHNPVSEKKKGKNYRSRFKEALKQIQMKKKKIMRERKLKKSTCLTQLIADSSKPSVNIVTEKVTS